MRRLSDRIVQALDWACTARAQLREGLATGNAMGQIQTAQVALDRLERILGSVYDDAQDHDTGKDASMLASVREWMNKMPDNV